MHVDPYIIIGSAVVGLLVGLTGAGGGALMTPMLILLFGVQAIGGDLQRPGRRGADAAGRGRRAPAQGHREPAPGRLDGARLGPGRLRRRLLCCTCSAAAPPRRGHVELALGAALLVGAAAMVLRYVLDRRAGNERRGAVADVTVPAAAHRAASAWSAA